MLWRPHPRSWGRVERRDAVLHLDGRPVGRVVLCGHDDPWRFGEFTPDPSFSSFAPYFAAWASLLHDGGDERPLSNAARQNLRDVERMIDGLRADLRFSDTGESRTIAQLNIDGLLIEWKEQ